jgi:hypothetical protein
VSRRDVTEIAGEGRERIRVISSELDRLFRIEVQDVHP